MKAKGFIAIAAVALLLTGCSDKYTNVIDKNTVIMTVGDVKVTKEEMYRFLIANDGASQTLEAMMNYIIDQKIETTEEMISDAKKQLENIKEMIGSDFETFIKNYGYKDEDDYFERVILYNARSNKLIAQYVETKFDTLALTQKPRKVQIIEIKDKDKAKEAFDKVKADEEFAKVGKEYGSVSFTGEEEVLLANSGIDSVVAARIQNTTTSMMIDEIIEGSNGNYYIVNVVEGDPEKFKDEAIEALANVSTISDEATRFYLKEAKFRIYDKLVYDQMKSTAPDLIFD